MMRLPRFWQRHFLRMEAGIIFVLTLLLTVWYFWFDGAPQIVMLMKENRANIYGTTATIAGALLGFSMAAVSIVLGFSSNERLELVRGSEHYPTLWKTFFQTIWWLGGLTVIALVCLIWDKDSDPVSWFVIPFFLFFGLSVIRVVRIIWLLQRLVEIIIKPSQK